MVFVSVCLDEMGQLPIINFGFVRYLKNKKRKGGGEYSEAVHRIQGSL